MYHLKRACLGNECCTKKIAQHGTPETLMFKSQRVEGEPTKQVLKDWGPWRTMKVVNKVKKPF